MSGNPERSHEGLTLYAELDDLEASICYGKRIISRA